MSNSFESWESLNEQGRLNRGKQILIGPSGLKQKVVYKVQTNSQFMIKLINMNDIFDSKGNLTSKGASSLINFINSQLGLVNTFGQLNSSFFKTNFIVYEASKYTSNKEKVQFKIVNRKLVPELNPKYQFVSLDALKAIKNKDESMDGIISSVKLKLDSDDIKDEPKNAIDGSESDAEGSNITKREAGYKFRYTMRSNSKTYLMEFTENGAIDSTVVAGGDSPNGAISWEYNKVMWYTDADNNKVVNDEPLYIDTEITNKSDNEFLTKIFTDDDFLNDVIKEYKEKYEKSEINADSLKSMLYYNSTRERMFPDIEEKQTGDIKQDTSTIKTASRFGFK